MASESLRTIFAVIKQHTDPDDGLDLVQRLEGLPLIEGYIAYVEWANSAIVRLRSPMLLEGLRAYFPRRHFEVAHPSPQDITWALEWKTAEKGDWSDLRLQ